MNISTASHKFLSRNGLMLFLAALCMYFSYYCVYGERSLSRLNMLQGQIDAVDETLDAENAKLAELQERVKSMRPGSLDRDLLEERARHMLGYRSADEWDVL